MAAAASSSSAAAPGSAAAASKRAAAEELNLVEQKLDEVDRQLAALKEERAVLLARQASLKEQLNAKTVDVDWSGRFAWDAEAARVKADVFGIAAPFRPLQVGGWVAASWGCRGGRKGMRRGSLACAEQHTPLQSRSSLHNDRHTARGHQLHHLRPGLLRHHAHRSVHPSSIHPRQPSTTSTLH